MNQTYRYIGCYLALLFGSLIEAKEDPALAEIKPSLIDNSLAAKAVPDATALHSYLYNPVDDLSPELDQEKIESIVSIKRSPPKGSSSLEINGKFLCIDGGNLDHMTWAMSYDPQEYGIVVVKHPSFDEVKHLTEESHAFFQTKEEHGRRFYLDTHGVLFTRLGVKKLPSLVTQQGDQLLIQELPINGLSSGDAASYVDRTLLNNAAAAKDLPDATESRSYLFNPFDAVAGRNGEVITGILSIQKNPLANDSSVELSGKYLFIDGWNRDQFAWAMSHNPKEYRVVFIRHPEFDKIKRFKKSEASVFSQTDEQGFVFYFDVHGFLSKKLGIQKVPSLVTQQGTQLLVEEFALSDLLDK